jgi:cell division protein FtsB
MSRFRNFLDNLAYAFKPANLVALLVLLVASYFVITYLILYIRAERTRQAQERLVGKVTELETTNKALKRDVQRLEAQCAELQAFVKRLSAESPVAFVKVLEQRLDADGVPITTVEFTETRGGAPLPPRKLTLRGREIYFDALVIKFKHDLVKVGDPLRGKSIYLFRRAFGSFQEPRTGPLLSDTEDGVPKGYRGSSQASAFEHAFWLRFWYWADHPEEADAQGVRVAQGEAPYVRPALNATYRMTIDHDGGLNIRKMEPAEPAPEPPKPPNP